MYGQPRPEIDFVMVRKLGTILNIQLGPIPNDATTDWNSLVTLSLFDTDRPSCDVLNGHGIHLLTT